jgi:hypothetical protein
MVFKINTSKRFNIGRAIFLEGQLERENVVELDARHAADKTFCHGLVFAYVHVLDVVELGVGRRLDVENEFLGFVVVNLK